MPTPEGSSRNRCPVSARFEHSGIDADAVLSVVSHAVVALDAAGTIVLVNARAARLFGYEPSDLLGGPIQLLVPRGLHDLGVAQRAHWSTAPQREFCGEFVARRRGGEEFIAQVRLSALEGTPEAFVAAIEDVTDRRRTEARFEGVLQAAPDAIVGASPQGTIELVNAQAEQLFGYERDELLGASIELLVPEAARGAHARLRAGYEHRPVSRPMGTGLQLAGRRKDGSEFPCEIALSSVESDGGRLILAAVRDISERLAAQHEREQLRLQAERERIERQLQQTRRLESLGQLAGGVAHDFNNLLAIIGHCTTFLGHDLDALTGADPERLDAMREDLGHISDAAERAARLTRQLLTFGRQDDAQPRALDLNAIVRSIDALLERTLPRHIELEQTLTDDLWSVHADPTQIEQVLVNLAVNARDAMGAGGTLTIATENVVLEDSDAAARALVPGRHVRLRVSDTGSGMTEDVRDRAFEPFFTTKPKASGAGLGLATVYGIVSAANGHVEIDSQPGQGTRMSILLPAGEPAANAAPVRSTTPRGGGGETVLVVEDDQSLRRLTRRILEHGGYQVLVAPSGPAAIELARTHDGPIDVLLTDVLMPQMLGTVVAERLRALRPDLHVVYMSGFTHDTLPNEGKLAPDDRLVHKPFTPASLFKTLRSTLDEPQPAGQ